MNVLFVCSRNLWRSPTAERLFARDPRLAVRSAGVAPSARRRVTAADVSWADRVLVMERSHRRRLAERFPDELAGTRVDVLEIPDDYAFLDPDLVELLEAAVPALLFADGGA